MYSVDLLIDLIKTQTQAGKLDWGIFDGYDASIISVVLYDFILYLEEIKPNEHYCLRAVHIPTGTSINVQEESAIPTAYSDLRDIYQTVMLKINS